MKNRKSLRAQLTLFIGLLFFIFGGILGVYFYKQTAHVLQNELIKRGKTLVNGMARNSRIGVQARNKGILSQNIQNILSNPDVTYAMVMTSKGEVLAEDYKKEQYKSEIPYITSSAIGVKVTSFKIRGEKFYDFVVPIIISTEKNINDQSVYGTPGVGPPTQIPTHTPTTTPKETISGFARIGMSTAGINYEIKNVEKIALLIILLSLIFSIAIMYFYIDYSIEPLGILTGIAKKVSTGDLTQKISIKRNDEVGLLAQVFDQMLSAIRKVIMKIQETTKKLTGLSDEVESTGGEVFEGAATQLKAVEETGISVEELNTSMREVTEKLDILSSSSEESSASTTELTATVAEVNSNMEHLSNAVEETSSSISQMTSAIKEVATHVEELFKAAESTAASMNQIDKSISEIENNTNDTLELAEKVTQSASEGKEAVTITKEGIEEIKVTFSEVAVAIENLANKTDEIGSILLVIDDIAEQTNLLALNAAIIAAQAGEEGKSFAVVADEIKELSERTSLSTKEVGDLIESLKDESLHAREALERTEEKVKKSVSLSEKAKNALLVILRSSEESSNRIKEISRSTKEQVNGSHQVAESINRIVEMARKISLATKEQEEGSERILQAVEDMRQITKKVKLSTQEQSEGSKQIMQAMENINQMVHLIYRSVQEQQKGIEHILTAMTKIQEITRSNQKNAGKLETVVKTINDQIEGLSSIVKYFHIGED